jgi:simple sugar transport system ATP-binding protein
VVANHDINITVRRGTVHALIGENGAGKSTLMKILYGMQKPNEGTIVVDGETVAFGSPADAIARGIGMVHQHFMLADNLTVQENIVLGAEKLYGIGARARRKIMEISDAYGLQVRPDVLVEEIGVADRQRVEILKVLYRGARTLILDEPTAVLVPQEVDALFDNLRELKAEGLTVIFISHKLGEVLSVADEITVIRRGTTVASVVPAETTPRQLAELMVGSELPVPETRESTVTDVPMLEVAGLHLSGTDAEGVVREVLADIGFTIHRGEVLGIAGVEGNGQAELVEAIMGIRDPDGGRITLDGEDISHATTRRRREHGVGYIPEDRHRHGLLLTAPLWENRMLGHITERPNSRGGRLTVKDAKADTERIVADYDVRTPGIDVNAASLSGGNQQKLIVGREMKTRGLAFDRTLASPAARVTETIDGVVQSYGALAIDYDRRVYLASTATLLDLVHARVQFRRAEIRWRAVSRALLLIAKQVREPALLLARPALDSCVTPLMTCPTAYGIACRTARVSSRRVSSRRECPVTRSTRSRVRSYSARTRSLISGRSPRAR